MATSWKTANQNSPLTLALWYVTVIRGTRCLDQTCPLQAVHGTGYPTPGARCTYPCPACIGHSAIATGNYATQSTVLLFELFISLLTTTLRWKVLRQSQFDAIQIKKVIDSARVALILV